MAFKLGKRPPSITQRTMAFKKQKSNLSVPGTPILKKDLDKVWPRGNGYITDPYTGKKYAEGDPNLPWEKNKIS